ncbi:MAG TPA: hypothetical protein VEW48_17030 [Thermoanaerobaculia bacterium]|nr:hypothetical protein [Thermoanaerobaculia bacterium]
MRLQRAEWAAALLITLFAVGLHALRLVHAGPLWRDEAAAFHLATSPTLGEVIARHESFPPPFFLIVRDWAAGPGGSDVSLRLFGLLAGLGLLALFWWTSRQTAGTVPLAALALVAVNPTVVLYGDELRGYGLGTLAILAAFGAFGRLVVRPDRRAIIAAMMAALLSVQLLFSNTVLLLALGLAAIGVGMFRGGRGGRRLVLSVVGIGAAAALSLLPWTGPVLATRSWSMLLEVPVGPWEIFDEMARSAASAPVDRLQWFWLVLIGLALTPGPSPASGRGVNSEDTGRDLQLFALLALPLCILAQWGFLEVLRYPPRPWYFLPVLALTAAALDVRLSASPLLRTARLGITVLAVLVMTFPVLARARVRMTNVDLIAARIAAEAAPGDLVVVTPWFCGISYLRYGQGATPWMTLPDLADHRIHRYDLVKARMMEPEPLRDVLGAVERTLRGGHRVWVVGELEIPPPGTPVPILPPAPAASSGWSEQPYDRSWSLQLGAFLRDHAAAGGRVPVHWDGPINGFERLSLLVLSGWR